MAALFLFLTSLALTFPTASADEHDNDVILSVHSRSFQQLSASSSLQPAERHAFTGDSVASGHEEDHDKSKAVSDSETSDHDEMHAYGQAVDRFADSKAAGDSEASEAVVAKQQMRQRVTSSIKEGLAAIEQSEEAALVENTRSNVQEALTGMALLKEQSKSVRQAVKELGLDFGLDRSAQLLAQDKAKAKLRQVGSDYQRLMEMTNNLDKHLERITGNSEKPQINTEDAEDAQFAALQKQTEHINEWFNKLKELKSQKDEVKAKKDEEVQAAAILGITPSEIQKELIKDGFHLEPLGDLPN